MLLEFCLVYTTLLFAEEFVASDESLSIAGASVGKSPSIG